MTTYYLLRVGSLVGRIVPVRLLYALAIVLARLAALPRTAARTAVRANIARVLRQRADSLVVR
nr:hypothetical protein [Chloroflexota bacterium]